MKNIVKSVFIRRLLFLIVAYVISFLMLLIEGNFNKLGITIVLTLWGVIYIFFLEQDIKFAVISKHFDKFDWDYVIKKVKRTMYIDPVVETSYIYMLALSHFNKYEDKMFLLYINRLPQQQKFIAFILAKQYYLFALEVMSGGEMVDYLYKQFTSNNNIQPQSNRAAELILKKYKKTITEEEKEELASLTTSSRIRDYVLDIEHNS